MKIAIVDDEKDMRQSISQWLALSGFETETYASAEDALKTVGADFPGVVVSDIRMPGIDGMQFLKRLMSVVTQIRTTWYGWIQACHFNDLGSKCRTPKNARNQRSH